MERGWIGAGRRTAIRGQAGGSVMAARARPVYELIGISQHSGTMGGGHYTAITRSADNGKWYDFNDSMVSPSQPSTPSKSAYVLFYRLVE